MFQCKVYALEEVKSADEINIQIFFKKHNGIGDGEKFSGWDKLKQNNGLLVQSLIHYKAATL